MAVHSTPIRLLHLVGSPTDDFYADLSLVYAADCLAACGRDARYESVIACVAPDRTWCFPGSLEPQAIAAAAPMTPAEAITRITAERIDVMVPQLFCRSGMTTYRALFDLLQIPYVGNTATTMALGADKVAAKALVAAAGVATPASEVLRAGEEATLPPPTVVKPADADNSLGVSFVETAEQYPDALARAREHSATVLVEDFVPLGREVRCGIVDRGGELICLPLEEYRMHADDVPVRLPQDKLAPGPAGGLQLMAKDVSRAWPVAVDDPVTAPVWAAARACHDALGCRHYSLFDFRVDPDGVPWFLEASLYCSFAEASVTTTMARNAGIGLDVLLAEAIDNARGGAHI